MRRGRKRGSNEDWSVIGGMGNSVTLRICREAPYADTRHEGRTLQPRLMPRIFRIDHRERTSPRVGLNCRAFVVQSADGASQPRRARILRKNFLQDPMKTPTRALLLVLSLIHI